MLTPIEKVAGRCVVCKASVVGYLVKAPGGQKYLICQHCFFDDVNALLEEKARNGKKKKENDDKAPDEAAAAK